jgi:3-isopropylmalate dehydrogenase
MPSSIKLAVIGGDGIGPEVTAEALKVLRAAAPDVSLDTTEYDLGARLYHRTGEILPETALAEIRAHDAVMLGAIGDPSVPHGVLERGILLRLRFELDHYVNLRPVKLFPGVSSPLANGTPETIDMVVIREGTEGPYTGAGGAIRRGTPQEIATQESVNTAFGVERVARYAFTVAASRPRKKLTLVHKSNVLTYAGELWQRIVTALNEEFPDVTVDYQHVDAASMFFVTQPERFDVVLTDNLFGDILTDLGAAIVGGVGLAASGNLDPSKTAPTATPTAAILSAAMLLSHLGHTGAAARIEAAVAADLVKGQGERSTAEVGSDIAERVSA